MLCSYRCKERERFIYVVCGVVCVSQSLVVAVLLAEMSIDDLEPMAQVSLLSLQPSERLHELSVPSQSFSSVGARHAIKLCEGELRCSAAAHGRVFAAALCKACPRVTPVRCYSRGHGGDWFRCCRAAEFFGEDVDRASVFQSGCARSTRRVVEQFCSLALHVSSMKTACTPWLQHTKSFLYPSAHGCRWVGASHLC